MSIPGSASPLLLASTAAAAGGYQVSRSLRFNSADSAYLSRTPAVAGNRRTWTWAGWIKKASNANQYFGLFTAGTNYYDNIGFGNISADTLVITFANSAGTANDYDPVIESTQVFRDPSAWYHVVLAIDTTQATASNRAKMYVNGLQVTTFVGANYPALNYQTNFFNTATSHNLGAAGGLYGGRFFNGYLADVHFIDGQALTPSSFTEVSATTGQLIPLAYSGSFGTNGFWLKFSDNSAATAATLGKDYSGNSNNWTPNNFSVLDGVTAGTGALPIYNTTSNNYFIKSTGTRSDAFSSSIALAVAMDGTNGGTTFADESATIKGSGSAKSLTVTSVTTSTTISKFYGSSGYFGTGGSTPNISVSPVNSFSTSDFTVELWYYATASQSDRILYRCVNGSQYGILLYMNAGIIQVYISSNGSSWDLVGGTSIGSVTTNQWTHIALVRNGSSFSGYMNGASTSLTTSSSSIASGTSEQIGGNGSLSFPGYIQDVRVYVGAAKYTTSFTVPSYSTSTAAGNDSLVDTPTSNGTDTGVGGEVRGNYATLNPLDSTTAPTNGNLDIAGLTTGSRTSCGTIAVSSGKWYWEVLYTAGADGVIGVAPASFSASQSTFGYSVTDAVSWYSANGNKIISGTGISYASPYTVNDVIGVALNLDAGSITFYKNGVSQGVAQTGMSGTFKPIVCGANAGVSQGFTTNAGQRAFAYTAPSGFKALCDTNLPAPVVAKPNTVMDVKLFSGNGSTQSITGFAFSPDFAWFKRRSSAFSHELFDVIRGGSNVLFSDLTSAEANNAALVTSFNSDGVSVGSALGANGSGVTSVMWAWDAGTSTVSNTAGSITSQVRANPTAGFSVVAFNSGSGAPTAYTVGHGLNVAPQFIITKSRTSASYNWSVYHTSIATTTNKYLSLNSTNATADNGTSIWGAAQPTSTVFGITSGNAVVANTDCIAYCFSPVVGYSSFGSFVPNGTADSSFVYCGFRPRFFMIKNTSATSNWITWDTARDSYNYASKELYPNLSDAEVVNSSTYSLDILSNGFKVRNPGLGSGGTWIFAAWAEAPFQYARAR